jgi:hypothetical protein
MNKYRYEVIYLNGEQGSFRADCFAHAIILAWAYAINKGWDKRIKYVTCEDGTSAKDVDGKHGTDIEFQSFKFQN